MPVNKGLLITAAFANGLNAFLDAREKGDLKRQQQALADAKKLMSDAQLKNLQQTNTLQGMKIEDYPEQQESLRQLRQTQAETALIRAQNQGKPDDKPLTPRQKTIQQIFAGADLLQRKDESDADYGKRLIEYPDSPGANPFVSQTIYEHINLNSADFSNFLTTHQGRAGSMDLAIKGHRIAGLAQDFKYNQQRTHALVLANQEMQRKIAGRDELNPEEKIKLLDTFRGHPELAPILARVTTYDQLDNMLGNSETLSLLLQPGTDYALIKGENGSVTAIDNNDIRANPVEIIPPMEGGAELGLDERFKLHDAEVKERNSWEQKNTTKVWREVRGQYNAAVNMIRGYNEIKWGDISEEEKTHLQLQLDTTLTNLMRKLIDPDSVVRNSEFLFLVKNQARIDAIWAWFESLAVGGVYNDNTRQSLAYAIHEIMNGIGQEYIELYNYQSETAIPEQNARLRGNLGLPDDFALNDKVILGPKPTYFDKSKMKVGPSGKKTPVATTGGATATAAQKKLAQILTAKGLGQGEKE